jgi:hypothetical protein
MEAHLVNPARRDPASSVITEEGEGVTQWQEVEVEGDIL